MDIWVLAAILVAFVAVDVVALAFVLRSHRARVKAEKAVAPSTFEIERRD